MAMLTASRACMHVGRMIVLAMMVTAVILIPVRAGQLYSALLERKVLAGQLPRPAGPAGRPFVLLSSRLSEVRAFSDFYREFNIQLQASDRSGGSSTSTPSDGAAAAAAGGGYPQAGSGPVHLVCLCNKPSGEFSAFQELHDEALSLVEGSVLSTGDLVRCRAAAAGGILILADR